MKHSFTRKELINFSNLVKNQERWLSGDSEEGIVFNFWTWQKKGSEKKYWLLIDCANSSVNIFDIRNEEDWGIFGKIFVFVDGKKIFWEKLKKNKIISSFLKKTWGVCLKNLFLWSPTIRVFFCFCDLFFNVEIFWFKKSQDLESLKIDHCQQHNNSPKKKQLSLIISEFDDVEIETSSLNDYLSKDNWTNQRIEQEFKKIFFWFLETNTSRKSFPVIQFSSHDGKIHKILVSKIFLVSNVLKFIQGWEEKVKWSEASDLIWCNTYLLKKLEFIYNQIEFKENIIKRNFLINDELFEFKKILFNLKSVKGLCSRNIFEGLKIFERWAYSEISSCWGVGIIKKQKRKFFLLKQNNLEEQKTIKRKIKELIDKEEIFRDNFSFSDFSFLLENFRKNFEDITSEEFFLQENNVLFQNIFR